MKDIWISVSGALAQQKNVDTIANNVANANTPGFKKDQLAFKEHLTVLEKGHNDIDLPNKEWRPEDFYKSYGSEKAMVKTDGSFTIQTQGNLSPTNNPFDLAISGKGFFEVLTKNGIRYTRKGNLSMDREGYIVTSRGDYLLGKQPGLEQVQSDPASADPKNRRIQISGTRFEVSKNGSVFVDDKKISEITVTEFKDVHTLKKEGNSMFINPAKDNLVENVKSSVFQGFIEESNVNAIEEMSKLIKAHRHFDSIKNVIKTYDDIAGKTASEIVKF